MAANKKRAGFQKSFPFAQVTRIKHVTEFSRLPADPGDATSNNPKIDFDLFADGVNLKNLRQRLEVRLRVNISAAVIIFASLLIPDQIFLNSKTTCSLEVCLKRLLVKIFSLSDCCIAAN